MAVEPAALQARAAAALSLAREAQQGPGPGGQQGGKQGSMGQGEQQGGTQQGAQQGQVMDVRQAEPEAPESLPWLLLCQEEQVRMSTCHQV